MPTTDPRVDAYIANAAEFARPILTYLREIVHDACPDVEETIKWRFPVFTYHGMLCNMAAHSQHCSFGFWQAELVLGESATGERDGMGNFGRITRIEDLPSRATLKRYVQKAARLNAQGIRKHGSSKPRAQRTEIVVPDDLAAALAKNEAARMTFERFSPSHRREYVEWVTEAKRPETRARRVATTVEWLAEGKTRNWKYETRRG